MSCLTINDNAIIVAKDLCFDYFNWNDHTIVEVPLINSKPQEGDKIVDILASTDGKYLALITSISKQLIIYELPLFDKHRSFVLPRSASKIRFTNNNAILVADKSGDALIYRNKDNDTGIKLLGHLSLLLDILQTNDEKFIITSDRDEKIKVSNYPKTYNIQTFCLGHKEFVNHIELLPHDSQYLTSTSGDGCIKVWDYTNGTLLYNIDTYLDVNDNVLKENFVKFMDEKGIEVSTLPIVLYSVSKIDECTSLLAVVVHSFHKILLYKIQTVKKKFMHTLIEKLEIKYIPASLKIHKSSLYIFNETDCNVTIIKISNIDGNIVLEFNKTIKMFDNKSFAAITESLHESVKVFYKRKFDNLLVYQERKKLRLEKNKES